MECLIPGLILVALMIYASTRIKKVSADAFKAETIETDAFIFEKTDEFLNKVEPSDGLKLEGYSREFGTGDASSIRQAIYEVRRLSLDIDTAVRAIPASKNDVAEIIGDKRYRLVEAKRTENGVDFVDTYKMAESGGRITQLRVVMLDEANEDVRGRVETILAGFIVK